MNTTSTAAETFRKLAIEKTEKVIGEMQAAFQDFNAFKKWLETVENSELVRINQEKDMIVVPWDFSKIGEPEVRLNSLAELDKMM